jgi:hypothetical protein
MTIVIARAAWLLAHEKLQNVFPVEGDPEPFHKESTRWSDEIFNAVRDGRLNQVFLDGKPIDPASLERWAIDVLHVTVNTADLNRLLPALGMNGVVLPSAVEEAQKRFSEEEAALAAERARRQTFGLWTLGEVRERLEASNPEIDGFQFLASMINGATSGQLLVCDSNGLTCETPKTASPYTLTSTDAVNEWLEVRGSSLTFMPPHSNHRPGIPGETPATSEKTLVLGVTTPVMALAFGKDNLNGWNEDKWARYLADGKAKWILATRVEAGRPGKISATWDPVKLALALLDKNVRLQKLDQVFKRAAFRKWQDIWMEKTELLRE